MVRLLAANALVSIVLASSLDSRAEVTAPRIRQQSCVVAFGGSGGPDTTASVLHVRFTVETPQTLPTIVWRANTQVGTVDFTANGSFSPHVSVYRSLPNRGRDFRIDHRRPRALTEMGPGLCSVVKTVDDAGESWEAPNTSPAAYTIPTPTPETATPVPATFDNPDHNPIGIVACQFSVYRGRSLGYIRFRNISAAPIDQVVFRALIGTAGIDYAERGTFTPAATVVARVQRNNDLPENAYQEYDTLDSPSSCLTVSARYKDGTVWQNPHAGPTEPPFPVGVP